MDLICTYIDPAVDGFCIYRVIVTIFRCRMKRSYFCVFGIRETRLLCVVELEREGLELLINILKNENRTVI